MNLDLIKNIISKRAEYLVDKIVNKENNLNDVSYFIAGNSLNVTNRKTDIDIFPVSLEGWNKLVEIFKPYLIYCTRNAGTYKIGKETIQVCKYIYPTLKELIYSFDYSHIQIGVLVMGNDIKEVFFTDEYLESKVIGNSTYVGSNYPLSSAIRAAKYKEYKEISKGRMIYSMVSALTDVIQRGFKDYEDFKDQLDAVDLGLLPEDFEAFAEDKDNKLFTLFKLLRKDN